MHLQSMKSETTEDIHHYYELDECTTTVESPPKLQVPSKGKEQLAIVNN